MRALIIAAALLAVSLPALARERGRTDGGVPSIMAPDPSARMTRQQRSQARRAAILRQQRLTARRSLPRSQVRSPAYGTSGIGESQLRQLQSSQQQQFEVNQLRQQIQRPAAPIGVGGCPGIGC